MDPSASLTQPHRLRRSHLFLLVPFLWQVGGVPWANGVGWRPFGMPFLLAWEMAGVVVASLAIALVHQLDRETRP